ncbi:DUF1015 family protein [Iocasia frigidifontis]|uniref:DUF1015 family protein n=1 Tax=Iocasia fonsfrigidae TaxID=2682810 RepID=A0A8A7KDM7_9FIRM|nr:DUF1015 domain-containing protein [Iocasia fonsfrigidae]QTL98205.1 DUF1015 family protein [Iocasia fonsfrigidae]
MARVYPFKGYCYNEEKVGDLNKIVTQPYDKIDQNKQDYYYQESDYNIVRLILAREEGEQDRYQTAASYLNKWVKEDALVQDKEPGFYAYWQEYKVEGKKYIRKGFVGLGKLEGEEGVKAHENTLEGPKADRLNLIRATEANFGHIFMLYSDPKKIILELLDKGVAERSPAIKVNDEDGNTHLLWKITDQVIIKNIQEAMMDKTLYIADGHHRYQTAVNYRNECYAKGWQSTDNEGFNHRLMTFINIDDPGLNILATHRMLYGLSNFKIEDFIEKARKDFIIQEYDHKDDLFAVLDDNEEHIFGFKARKDQRYYSLRLEDNTIMERFLAGRSAYWKNLDVVILHKIILEQYLGIDEQALAAKSNIDYVRYRETALNKLAEGNYQAAFILNPTKVAEVKNIADENERMPQKSTDFYPKLLTGLVINRLNIKKD